MAWTALHALPRTTYTLTAWSTSQAPVEGIIPRIRRPDACRLVVHMSVSACPNGLYLSVLVAGSETVAEPEIDLESSFLIFKEIDR